MCLSNESRIFGRNRLLGQRYIRLQSHTLLGRKNLGFQSLQTQDANDVSTDPVVASELKQPTKMELFRLAKRVFEYLVEHFKDNTPVPKLSEIKHMLGDEDGKHYQRACDSQYFNNSNICQATQFNQIGNIVHGERRSVNYCRQSAEDNENVPAFKS